MTTLTSAKAVTASSLTNSGITATTEFRFVEWRTNATNSSTAGTGRLGTPTLFGTTTLRSAGTLTWDGGRGSGAWDAYDGYAANQSNWNLNNIPTSGLVDSLTFAGSTQTTTNNTIGGLTIGSITFAAGAGAFVNSGSAVTLNGDITNSSSNLQTISHAVALSSGTHVIDTSGSSVTISGSVTGAGGSITKTGGSTLSLTNASSSFGTLTINAGTASIGANTSITGLGGSGGGLNVSSGTLTLNLAADTVSSLPFSGGGGLTKTGSSSLTLTGNSSAYSGPTTVSAGKLRVDGVIGSGSLSVAATAWLMGTGTVLGPVTVGGTLAPGASPGVITLGSLTLTSTSTTIIELTSGTSRGVDYDGVTVTTGGGLTYGGVLQFAFGGSPVPNGTYDIFDFTGGSTGSLASVESTGFYAGTWANVSTGTFQMVSGTQTLTFSQPSGEIIVVPEPAALTLAGLGLGIMGCRRLLRRRA